MPERRRPIRRCEIIGERVDKPVTDEAEHFLRCPHSASQIHPGPSWPTARASATGLKSVNLPNPKADVAGAHAQ
jgi:hypothetical protein